METTAGVVVFTQDDLNSAVENARTSAQSRAVNGVLENVLLTFREEVAGENLERDYATALYNTIAEKSGGSTVESIGGLYTVEVTYDHEVIYTANGVEARDEDDACEQVSENISVDDVTLSFVISYNGDYETVETSYDRAYRIQESLEFNATEE